MSYALKRTDKALESMKNVLHFIACNHGPDIALEKIDELENAIHLLAENPYIGTVPVDKALKRQGYRILITEMDVVFYKVDEKNKEVVIHLVADQRQDYIRLLR